MRAEREKRALLASLLALGEVVADADFVPWAAEAVPVGEGAAELLEMGVLTHDP